MHPVDSWLQEAGKTRPWLAEAIGVSRATLSRMIAGKQWPHRKVVARLAKVTSGAVTANDFVAPSERDEAA